MTRRLKRPPTTPGEILREEFLAPLGITQRQLADHIGCDVKVINRVVNGRTKMGVSLAVRLASALHTTAEFWLNAQRAVDLFEEYQRSSSLPEPIRPTGS
ncbi:MAG: HigA family addiction module antidote protein [Deltaproteobacteria bacterium]|nr:HigA family addiction module antidote protein [Deltaproteobacteria bacterium]